MKLGYSVSKLLARLLYKMKHTVSDSIADILYIHTYVHIGVGAGPAGQVLAGPLLSKVKMKLHFCKKQAMNRSASMIFRLVRLIILLYNR